MKPEKMQFRNGWPSRYAKWQPQEGTYTSMSRNSILAILTILIGLMGGLVTGLKLIIPIFVKLAMKCLRKQRSGSMKPIGNNDGLTANISMEIQIEQVDC